MKVKANKPILLHCGNRITFNKAIITEINVADPHMEHMRVNKKVINTA